MKTLIFGKKSYLSDYLKKSITNSKVYSLSEKNLDLAEFENSNIIINSFYSSLKLEKIDDYELLIKKSIFELSKLLDKIKKKKINIIIYTSSSSIYNSFNENIFKDERNRKVYAALKIAAENLMKNFCYENKIKLCITRVFNIFGENEKFSIISKIVDCYKSKTNKLKLINKGQSIRDFIYIKDVVKVYREIIKTKSEGIIDIGSGFGIEIHDIIKKLGTENFIISNIKKSETNFSIAQKIRFYPTTKNSLENFLFKNLNLKKKIELKKIYSTKKNVLEDHIQGSIVYGAGKTGQQLQKMYKQTGNNLISYFVDDDKKILKKKTINGIKILSFQELILLSKQKIINNIIIAIPSLPLKKLESLVSKLTSITLNVSFINLNSFGEKNYLSLSNVSQKIMSEIFKRETSKELRFVSNIYKKNILITGAGGSIGSELVKQSLICGAKVIALDHSELALYNLEKDLNNQFSKKKLITVLGSINDKRLLDKIKNSHDIDIIFHAAAYKHVNLLEKNITLAVQNNILATKNILDVFNNRKFEIIIISTDKAARPKSILGATKRISEIMCQNLRNSGELKSILKIVRFGNVFGSKGSAIELFIEQINNGLPITITDFRVKRYFMSIQEACNLVINVTRIQENKKIFILDMGKQIFLKDIVYKLIELKNLKKSKVKIKEIGLKKGEKVVEELSINKKIHKTANKEIFLVNENYYKKIEFDNFFMNLKKNLFKKNDKNLRAIIFSFLKNEK